VSAPDSIDYNALTMLARHGGYAELCGFNGGTPDRTTFSKLIAEPQTVEGVFNELRSQALKMGLYGKGKVKVDIYTYLRRKRKAGVSDRGAWEG